MIGSVFPDVNREVLNPAKFAHLSATLAGEAAARCEEGRKRRKVGGERNSRTGAGFK
jgi:hypothetical protein